MRPERIAEPDVHPQPLADRSEPRVEHRPHAGILLLCADRLDTDRTRVENHSVVRDAGATDGGDVAGHGVRIGVAPRKQVQIHGGPVWSAHSLSSIAPLSTNRSRNS